MEEDDDEEGEDVSLGRGMTAPNGIHPDWLDEEQYGELWKRPEQPLNNLFAFGGILLNR